MSIFRKIKEAKKAADEKKAKDTEQKPPPPPYKHIPTHAATDALAGAPMTNFAEERAAIKAAHLKRQSTLSQRNGSRSSLSTLQRADSYQSMNMEQRRSRAPTRSIGQFQSLKGLVVPEGEVSEFTLPRSQDPSPTGHSSHGSSASSDEALYVELPRQQAAPKIVEQPTTKSTRPLGYAPRLSAPPSPVAATPSPVSKGLSRSATVTEVSAPPMKKRKSWRPFSSRGAPVIAAH